MGNSRKIFILNEKSIDSLLDFLDVRRSLKFFLLLAFPHRELKDNLDIILRLKNKFFQLKKAEYLKDLIIISDFVYLANDLGVRAVVCVNEVTNDLIKGFMEDFNNFEGMYHKTEDYLLEVCKREKYTLDVYNNRGPWLISVNNLGILFINEKTFPIIDENYLKVKNLHPDITVVSLNGDEYDDKCLSLLKMIGSDALITFGITAKKSVQFNKRLDYLVYDKSPFKEEYMRKFLTSLLTSEDIKDNFNTFMKFLGIPMKDFSADLNWDEEEELNKKVPKYGKLKLLMFDKEKRDELKTGILDDKTISVVREKKGTYYGKSQLEYLTFEILKE